MRWNGFRGAWVGGVVVLVSLVSVGCGGSGGNNDQGIVFRATGTFRGLEQIDDRIQCTEPTIDNVIGDTAFSISRSTARFFPDRNDPFGDPCGGYIALENNLARQSLNVQEIALRYEVPGASIAIPENSVTTGQTIQSSETPDDQSSSGKGNLLYLQLVGQIVPAPLMVFLNVNSNRLPQTPFFMNVFMVARGQSDDGSRYETNEIGYQLTIRE